MIIHATRKLAARLPDVSSNPLPEDSLLGGWHADRLTIDRVQCVLFCHDASRAVLFLPRVRKPQFAELGSRWFPRLLTATLATLGCPDSQIALAERTVGTVRFDRATDRSVLGSMNIATVDLLAQVRHLSHVLSADPLSLSAELTDRPATVRGKWIRPKSRLLELVAELASTRH